MTITIFYIILYILEAFILWQYCTTALIPRKGKTLELISCVAGYGVLYLLSQLDLFWSNLISIFVVHFLIIMVAYKHKWYTVLLHSVITTMIMASSELIVLAIVSRFTTNIYAELSYFALGTFISKLLYFIILFAISHIIKGRKEHKSKPNKGSIILIIIPITSAGITVTLFSVCLYTNLSFIQDLLISISAVLILVINLLIFYFYDYNQSMNDNYTNLQILLQKENDIAEYYKMLVEHDEKQRILIHDIKNHLATILNMNDSSSSNQISEYITRIINEPAMQTSLKLCDNELLNVILTRYMKLCNDKNIQFITDIRSNSVNFLKNEEITSLFANLLDNAMEAAIESEHPLIEIKAASKSETVFTLISVTNSCDKEPVTDRHGNLITSKTDKKSHGIGMKSIKRIVNSYDGNINYKYDNEFSMFSTTILLKNS